MRIDIITIFPEYFGALGVSLIGKAAARGTSRSVSTTCGTGPTTCTARWTTRRSAAAPGWS